MRAKTIKLQLTEREQQYLEKILIRHELVIARLPVAQQQSAESKAALLIRTKLGPSMATNRVDLRILQRLIETFILLLRTQTLPELDRRLRDHPDYAIKYRPYVTRAEGELELMIGLSDKIGAVL